VNSCPLDEETNIDTLELEHLAAGRAHEFTRHESAGREDRQRQSQHGSGEEANGHREAKQPLRRIGTPRKRGRKGGVSGFWFLVFRCGGVSIQHSNLATVSRRSPRAGAGSSQPPEHHAAPLRALGVAKPMADHPTPVLRSTCPVNCRDIGVVAPR